MRYAVIRSMRVGRTTHHIAKLIITDTPEGTTPTGVTEAIDAAGRAPMVEGIAWADHDCRPETKWPKAGVEGLDQAETLTWQALTGSVVERRVTLRVPAPLYSRAKAAADRAGISLQAWSMAAYAAYLTDGE